RLDPRDYVKVGSIYPRLRRAGVAAYVIQPEPFRLEAMDRMHAAGAEYAGYYLPTSMSVRLRDLVEQRPWGDGPAYVYAYWAGIFGRGDPKVARRRIGEVLAMLGGDRAASIVKVDGQTFRHRGSHGGMSPEEMRIPVLAWRA